MKKGGTRSQSSRASGSAPRESWRKWLMCLLALGFALLVITMLSKENSALIASLEKAESLLGKTEEDYDEYPLQFDLPMGWIMTEGCTIVLESGERRENVDCGDNIVSIDEESELPVLDRSINPEAVMVYLQNTDRLPLFGGIAPNDAVQNAYESNDVALITVTRVTGPDILTGSTGEVTDLGEGFYKVTICDVVASPECQMYGQWAHEYYFFGETGAYRMSVTSTLSEGVEAIEEIILSVHE